MESIAGGDGADPATLDQLRVLLAVVEAGSFSAAGRRLHRVQSAVSHAVATVEGQLGVALFDRSARGDRQGRPTLTPAGEAVVALARDVCARADALRRLAGALRRGEEPVLSVALDGLFPATALAAACRAFAETWPAVALRIHTDTLGAVAERVRDGTCRFGVVGPAAPVDGLVAAHLGAVRMITVVAPGHPLSGWVGPVPVDALAEQVQIVWSERGTGSTPDQAVVSSRTWRVHDLQTKRVLLCDGLGWGNLPEAMVADDLVAGRLVRVRPAPWPPDGLLLALTVVTRPDTALGTAAAWLIGRLAAVCN
ncbi:MAG: LysR family transcriptional regulator, partial [Myxococcota bacterium]